MLQIALSPLKDMNIDGLRVAIINYLLAQQKNDKFLVRIDDRDRAKNIEGKDSEFIMILEKFALKHDGVFHQSEHLNLHQTLAIKLLKEKKAYICQCKETSCTQACQSLPQEAYQTLKASKENFVIRLKKPKSSITFTDIIQGEVTTTQKEIGEFIILDNKGIPSDDFACATDDMMSGIDFIVRSKSYLLNTPKQIYVQQLLGYDTTATHYAHIPPIKNAPTLQWLFEEGFIPDAILNYLITIGNTKIAQEIFTLPQAIEWFSLESISKEPVAFNLEKLRELNREHLKMMDNKRLSSIFGFADADIGKLAKVYLDKSSTTKELKAKILPIFKAKEFKGQYEQEMRLLESIIASAPAFEDYDAFEAYISTQSGLKEENLLKPLRYLLTNRGDGPQLSEIYPFIKSYILEVAS